MKVAYLAKFSKDLDKLRQAKDKEAILRTIEEVKQATSLPQLSGVKKLSGFQNAYRIRCGHFRIGIFLEDDTAVFARVAHRKDIYDIFP
jgi:mRNA interferase RelE/StbE